MRRRALLAATSLVALIQACDPLEGVSLDWDFGDSCGIGLGPRPCVAIEILPKPLNVLRGDTVRLYTFSDSGFGRATWSVTGDAASYLLPAGALTGSIAPPESTVVLKGIAAGAATVDVQSANSTHSASSDVFVADSSVVTSLQLVRQYNIGDTVTVGTAFTVYWSLRDANFRTYLARPSAWTVSDALVLESAGRNCTLCSEKFVARSPGTVVLIAEFVALRDTLRFVVVP